MTMIKQMKAKGSTNISPSNMPHDLYEFFTSIKYDGNYVQIHLDIKGNVEFFTSGNKRFHLSHVANQLKEVFQHVAKPLVLESEYLYDCAGRLGDRVYSARLTKYRTLFASASSDFMPGTNLDVFKVFNIIGMEPRWHYIDILRGTKSSPSVHIVKHELITYADAKLKAKEVANEGWEGLMLQSPYEAYREGKRVNYSIKLKARGELIARVINEEMGEGRLAGVIGSLVCELDNGVRFKVGSGLDDYMRSQWGVFIGRRVEVEYEQISADDKPLQPVFKRLVGEP